VGAGAVGTGTAGASGGASTSQEGQTCLGCHATSTPEWRRGPLGEWGCLSILFFFFG